MVGIENGILYLVSALPPVTHYRYGTTGIHYKRSNLVANRAAQKKYFEKNIGCVVHVVYGILLFAQEVHCMYDY